MIDINGIQVSRKILLPEIEQYSSHLKEFIKLNKNTIEVEVLGKNLVDNWDGSWTLLHKFIEAVLKWGGSSTQRNKSNILEKNYYNTTCNRFKYALEQLSQNQTKNALERLLAINGFGFSIATKHLRFLNPEKCGVLDRILRENMGYPETPEAYDIFCTDLRTIVNELKNRKIENPLRNSSEWYIADAEAAIFHYFNGQ